MLTAYRCLFIFLFAVPLGLAQSPKPLPGDQTSAGKNAAPTSPQLSPETPVITIQGLCNSDPAQGDVTSIPSSNGDKTCQAVVTRAQFENLVKALLPVAPPAAKRKFAEDYPETLLFAERAREVGLDKDPDFQETLKFAALRTMSTGFVKHAQDQSREVSDAEVEKAYKGHPELFLKIDLMRIYVPKEKEPPSQNQNRAAVEAEMRQVAEKIRAKAAAGADFEKLQDEAYKAAGMSDPPDVHVGDQTRGTMSLDYQRAAFELEPGQISQVVLSPIGFHIFKINSKTIVPLSEARPILQQLRYRETIQAAKKGVKWQLNEDYFTTAQTQSTTDASKPK